jgi:hypothetical protein
LAEWTASAGEQILALPLFAEMPGSEKNRYVFPGARRAFLAACCGRF